MVPFGEGAVGGDGDLVLLAGDGDGVAKSTGLAADLDSLLEELFEGGDVHDLILHRLRAVDDEGRSLLLALGPRCRPTTHFSLPSCDPTDSASDNASKPHNTQTTQRQELTERQREEDSPTEAKCELRFRVGLAYLLPDPGIEKGY